jgi:hypothetical protein
VSLERGEHFKAIYDIGILEFRDLHGVFQLYWLIAANCSTICVAIVYASFTNGRLT